MSIDSLYEGLLTQLNRMEKIVQVSKELVEIEDMDEKVLYVYYLLLRELKLFPEIIVVDKTADVSTHYRNLGNNCFQKSDDYKAWQYYNLSLLHAPSQSEHYAFALANRSAVFFSMKKYSECLEDIHKVFHMSYPEKLKEKLKKRQAACQEMIVQIKAHNEDVKLRRQIDNILALPKSNCSCAHRNVSHKLQLLRDTAMGVQVVAKEDIQVGEVLLKEEPYLNLLLKSQFLFACSYCMSRNMSLIPCDKCCFALYCNDLCKRSAWADYHKIECSLMATLLHMEFTKLELLTLRIVIKARLECSSWDELFQKIIVSESFANTEFRGHKPVGSDMIFSSKNYEAIHTLETNMNKRSVSDIFRKCVSAAVLLRLLEAGTEFIEVGVDEVRDSVRRCVAQMLFRHLMTSPTNMHSISSNVETKDGDFVDELSIGSAPYGYLSFFNHSCCPNVVRCCKLGTSQMTLVALRPIKKGAQIYDNYGMHHAVEDVASRQAHLKGQYKFTCLCEACTNNWPKFNDARPGPLDAQSRRAYTKLLDLHIIDKLQKGNRATALVAYKLLCKLAEACEKYAPCRELFECQEAIKQCLAIFEGVVPYGYTQTVEWKAIPPKV